MYAQLTVTGTVFDSSKRNYVENVRVESSSGKYTRTDSMGRYKIAVTEKDSLTFIYKNKPTQKFAVNEIPNLMQFDLSLGVTVKSGYRVLKEVVIFARSYREDSMENRQTYADVYNYRNPTIRTSISPGGAVGADVNEIINMFRFKRNKRLKAFQARLEQQEQDQLSSSLSRLLVVSENYPQLKSNENFLNLQSQLEGTENRISVERRRYNETVQAYNTEVKSFPALIMAKIFGFKEREYFKSTAGSEKAPDVNFDFNKKK